MMTQKTNMLVWQSWVYSPYESHFFWLCDHHIAQLLRKDKDGQGSVYYTHKCDYPKCKAMATTEYYPNLMTQLMEAEEDIKNSKLHKVTTNGERVQPKAVSQKRSKKAKLSVSSSKRSNKTR